jgi:hypothetical protein
MTTERERYFLAPAEAVRVRRPGVLGRLVGRQSALVEVPIDTEARLPGDIGLMSIHWGRMKWLQYGMGLK